LGCTGGGKAGKNRAKLYAVSCPDVAQHTQCANVDHGHQHQALHYEPDPNNPHVLAMINQSMGRLGIGERIEEGPGVQMRSGGGFVDGGFTHAIVPDGYRSVKEKKNHGERIPYSSNKSASGGGGVCLGHKQSGGSGGGGGRGHIISNVQLAQSHPHLFVNNSTGQVGYYGNQRESTNNVSGPVSYNNSAVISASYQNLPHQTSSSFYLHNQQERLKQQQQPSGSKPQQSGTPDQQYLRVNSINYRIYCSYMK
jgi:hypothetical protein